MSSVAESLGGNIQGEPVVVSFGDDRLDVFAQRTDNTILHKWRDDDGVPWKPSTGWSSLGDPVGSDGPCAVAWGNDSLHVFARGTDNDVWYKWGNGREWNPPLGKWKKLGKSIVGRPTVVAWSENRLDIFAQGTDRSCWHRAWDGQRWQNWESLGGLIVGEPSAVSWGPNRLDVFVCGVDNAVHHKAWDGTQWHPSQTGWVRLGGQITGVPSAVSWAPNRLDIFVLGIDKVTVYHKWWGGKWSNFTAIGGNALTGPRAVAARDNLLDIVIQGHDRSVCHKSWNGASWVPTSGWRSFGGIVDGTPVLSPLGSLRLEVFGRGTNGDLLRWA
ncbi:unnamed protein product [Clonostachys rosea f. rosea IK726]|uniref:Uncharacterized protein n=1 Tax=Clonostachys rosea f. rosea IK726 TaxID=1349383 RepID=A0ACA9UHI3_BIOOC|nr:unnamed protein product [Clonostachys rosea f. rosea IK726]